MLLRYQSAGCGAFLSAAVFAAAGCESGNRIATARADEPARIVFGRSIGGVRLDMHRSMVERRYGKPDRVSVLADYFPVGTRYQGKRLVRVFYRIHGALLRVGYVDDRVKTVDTTSSYYRTAAGMGAGTHLPADRCARLDDTGHVGPRACKGTWHGFTFDGECLDAWLRSSQGRMTLLKMHQGRRIESVEVGESDVILPCF